MKLKSAILGFLSSTAARQPRTDVVQFLRRYADPSRHVTHYRAYGAQARNVKSFLDRLGLAENSDYTIVRSEYDPETAQFRWNDTKPVRDFVRLVTSVGSLAMERFAAKAIAGSPGDAALAEDLFRDDEDPGRGEEKAAEHPLPDFRACNMRLLEDFSAVAGNGVYLGESYVLPDVVGPGFAGAWVILPPSVIESFVLVVQERRERLEELFGEDLPFKSGIFQKSFFPFDSTGVRFLGKGEDLVGYGRMFDSPFEDLMRPGSPMVGYLATSNTMVNMKSQEGKDFAFMRTDDWLSCNVGTVDWAMRNPGRFWKYVRCLYEAAYGTEAFVVPQSRLAMPASIREEGPAGGPLFPAMDARGTHVGRPDRIDRIVEGRGWASRTAPCAVLGVVIGHGARGMLERFPDAEKTEEKGPTYVTEFPEEEEETATAFSDTNMDRSDEPYEWFDMFHRAARVDAYADHATRNVNFTAFRAAERALTPARAASLSAFDCLNPIARSADDCYTTASAFVYSVIAAIRARTPDTDADVKYAKAKTGTYSADLAELHSCLDVMVTAVYTGVVTDRSAPTDTETFPALPTCATAVCAGFTDEVRKTFTRAIDAIGRNGLQYKMAKRTAGTRHRSVVVIETNVDAKWFFDNAADQDTMRSEIATSFLRTLCSRTRDPLNSRDEDNRRRAFSPFMLDTLSKAVELDKLGWDNRPATPGTVRVEFSQIYGDGSTFTAPKPHWLGSGPDMSAAGIDVGYGVDESGRLFVIATVKGESETFARYAYRLENALPVKSASLRRRTEADAKYMKELSDGRIYISTSCPRQDSAVVRRIFEWYAANHSAFEPGTGELPADRHTFGPHTREPRLSWPTDEPCGRSYYTEAACLSA